MQRLCTFSTIGFSIIGLSGCYAEFYHMTRPWKPDPTYHHALPQGGGLGATGSARMLENGNRSITLSITADGPTGVGDLAMKTDPIELGVKREDDTISITWEVRGERWEYRKPFDLLLKAKDPKAGNILIRVQHPQVVRRVSRKSP